MHETTRVSIRVKPKKTPSQWIQWQLVTCPCQQESKAAVSLCPLWSPHAVNILLIHSAPFCGTMLYSRKFRYRRLSFSRTLCKQTLQKANADSGISMVTKGLGAIGIIESLIGVGLGIGSMIGIRPKVSINCNGLFPSTRCKYSPVLCS